MSSAGKAWRSTWQEASAPVALSKCYRNSSAREVRRGFCAPITGRSLFPTRCCSGRVMRYRHGNHWGQQAMAHAAPTVSMRGSGASAWAWNGSVAGLKQKVVIEIRPQHHSEVGTGGSTATPARLIGRVFRCASKPIPFVMAAHVQDTSIDMTHSGRSPSRRSCSCLAYHLCDSKLGH